MWINIFKKKTVENIKKDFFKKHNKTLPKYSPYSGIKIKWHLFIDQDGPYNPQTGEALGEIKIIIIQEPPTALELLKDDRYYEYSILEKKMIISNNMIWDMNLDGVICPKFIGV